MVPAVRSWIGRHRIANLLATTCGFTGMIRGLLAASGMGAPWTLSILVGFGGLESPVVAAVAVALAFGIERLSTHEVPAPSGVGVNDGYSRPIDSKGMRRRWTRRDHLPRRWPRCHRRQSRLSRRRSRHGARPTLRPSGRDRLRPTRGRTPRGRCCLRRCLLRPVSGWRDGVCRR
jgi:hypothetical protein